MNRHFEACVRAYICPLRLLWDCLRPKPYLEAEDDGPDEAEGEAVVAVDDVVGAHVLQVNLLFFEELQGLVHVLQAVDPHAALSGFRLREGEGEREREECRLLLLLLVLLLFNRDKAFGASERQREDISVIYII